MGLAQWLHEIEKRVEGNPLTCTSISQRVCRAARVSENDPSENDYR